MAAFNVLPSELVLQIFSKIKYEDRFETFRVSYEWFFLTLKTYKDTMTPKNDLLVTMADFFNKTMGAKKFKSWMQLFRYMKLKKVEMFASDSPAYIKAVDKCKPSIKLMVMDMVQFLTEFWKAYPNLRAIKVRYGAYTEDKVQVLKDAFGPLFNHQLLNTHIPGHCPSFRLKRVDSTFALSLVSFSGIILAPTLKAIKESKTVDRYYIMNPVITSKWNKLFPSSVRRIVLVNPVIMDSVVPQIKDLLYFVFQDWTSLNHFKIQRGVDIKYQCYPRKREELFYISCPEIPSNFNNGFQYSRVKIVELSSVDYLKESLPPSVTTLMLTFNKFSNQFSPKKLFSRAPNLKTLTLIMPDVKNLSFGDLTGLDSLHTLVLTSIGPEALATIFLSLPSLTFLATGTAEEGTFTRLPRKEVVCKSLKTLTVENTGVSNSFILRHVENLEELTIDLYDPKKHQVGYLCSSYYNLDFVTITGKFDILLCRAIGSDLADYPYKCIIAAWNYRSIDYFYYLSRKVEPLRNRLMPRKLMCFGKCAIYVYGFSVAFLQKMHNVDIYSDVKQFLNIVN